MDLRKLV